MIWMLIIIFIVIFFLFMLAFIGLNNRNKQTPDKKGALVVNSSLPNSLECAKNKVTCNNSEQCNSKCTDNVELECVKIQDPTVKEYSYIFSKNMPIEYLNDSSKSVTNVKNITIPSIDNNGKKVNVDTLKGISTIYINFKYSKDDQETNIINANYGNFISYIKGEQDQNIINLTYKISDNVYDISQKGDIAIKWYNINVDNIQGYCVPKTINAIPPCNAQKGGVLTWTGWTNPNAGSWSCICRYPAFSNGGDCGQLNPNVCAGGTFVWNSYELPTDGKCTCNEGNELVKDYRGVPYCVPSEYKKWYTTYFTPTGDIIQDARIKK
jgi:hypothetical protein